MIATGGLLRINARRQDSLRSKPHRTLPCRKKSQKKRRSEVVVVKGKVKLFSVSGLVAVLGVLVLFLGVCMAALGYWPQDGLLFRTDSQQGSAMALVTSSSSSPATLEAQEGERRKETKSDEGITTEGDEGFNHTESINGTSQQILQSFLEKLLNRYLYSDCLKVFGPLIMGIGIFLFICANAVLHENRDKKTKIINLQDIYSTVIDIHSSRKPPTPGSTHLSSANPLNGLINCAQSESLNIKPRVCPGPVLNKKEGGLGFVWQAGRSGNRGETERGDDGGVFCIFQKQLDPLPGSYLSFQHREDFCSSHALTCYSPPERELWHSFTFPLHRICPPNPNRRHSVCMGSGATGAEEKMWEDRKGERSHASPTFPLQHFPAMGGNTQALTLLSCSSITSSYMSHSSLFNILPLSFSSQALPCRRKSFPTDCRKPTLRQENSCVWSSLQKTYLESEKVMFQSGVRKDPISDIM